MPADAMKVAVGEFPQQAESMTNGPGPYSCNVCAAQQVATGAASQVHVHVSVNGLSAAQVRRTRLSPVSGSMHALVAVSLLASFAASAVYLFFLRQQKQFTGNLGPRRASPTRGSPGDDIVITGFFTPVGKLAGSVSPFTNKIETYLRFAGLPFKTENGGFAGSPKGRVCTCTCFLTRAYVAGPFHSASVNHVAVKVLSVTLTMYSDKLAG